MAFAIVETGGKQYRVSEGQVLSVEKLAGHVAGDTVVFDKVLLIDDGTTTQVGTPYLEGATVEVTLTTEGKGKKLHIQKFKSKSRYKRRLGHRQPFAQIAVKKVAKK
jgi:large subunit ribosomal protein L21